MPMSRHAPRSAWKRLCAPLLAAVLAACGGGGGSDSAVVPDTPDPGVASDCSVAGHQAWLNAYLDHWYYWYALAPRPSASGFADVQGFFDARLYAGSDPRWPADRWSGSESSESFNRFYGDGATMGYGVAVAGLEVAETSNPLLVRSVEPLSPAGLQGVQRGDEVLQINGRPAAELTLANDFSALTADREGDTLVLRLRREGVVRDVSLRSAVFNLSPVLGAAVHATASGRRVAYVRVQNMISQVLSPLRLQFVEFRNQGVQDLVLDLRYNGGGLVSVGGELASLVAGARANGLVYSSLIYNDRRAGTSNQDFRFTQPAQALGLPRVLVLAGRRTCSASEQLVNGLRGAGVEVVLIGETTCGKPVGFLPREACGLTYSVVNFESVNHLRQGGYYEGFSATCPVAENFSLPVGDASRDPLLDTALRYAQTGSCPAGAADASGPASGRARPLSAAQGVRGWAAKRGPGEPGERQDMIPR